MHSVSLQLITILNFHLIFHELKLKTLFSQFYPYFCILKVASMCQNINCKFIKTKLIVLLLQ